MSPRERFQTTEHAKAWANLSASAAFVTATDFAMLQAVDNLSGPASDPNHALAQHYRLEGCRMFLRTLEQLAEQPKLERPAPIGQLDHRA